MAIDMKEFSVKVDIGLKSNKTATRFFYRFKKDEETRRGVLDYSNKSWDKRTRVSKAKAELIELKNRTVESGVDFTENTKLNELAKIYFDKACDDTEWTQARKDAYRLYCEDGIGKKQIKNIRQVDIDSLKKSMETKGRSKQTMNGVGPRTIKKILVQVLKPILQYAVDNKVLQDIPNIKPQAWLHTSASKH
jgi:hypothetical protein